jgi:hypothetical protein
MFGIGDDFWIENATGRRMFKVNGKLLRVRHAGLRGPKRPGIGSPAIEGHRRAR